MKKNFLTSRFCFAILSCLVSILVAAQPDTWQSKAGGYGNISQFAFSINGKGYFGLGPASPEVWEYDAALDVWTQKADFPGALRNGTASFATTSKGYVGTGTTSDFFGTWLNDFWEFDPVANSWTARATFPGGVRYNGTGFSIGAKGYIGMGYNGSYLNDLWEYDPASDTWTAKANLPSAGREGPFSFSAAGMGYVGTGKTDFFGPWTNDFWQYNPGTDSWVRKADFTTLPRWGATGGAIGNRGFAGGGYDNVGFVFLNDFWEYDPASDTWIQRANLGGGVRSGGQTFSIGGKLFLGMGGNPSQLFDLWEYTPTGGMATPPAISSFAPISGPVGTTVTITGTNFSATPANNIVYFGATRATVTAASTTQLTVTVPVGATYEPITVQVAGLTGFSSKPFVVTFPGGGSIDACSFAPKVDFAADSNPFGVMASDFDGDGKPDIAVVNRTSRTLLVYRNTSSLGLINAASLAAPISRATAPVDPIGAATADLDGDGKLDIVLANAGSVSSVSVYRNTSTTGNVSFDDRVDYGTGVHPINIAINDLDNDGKPEIVVCNRFSNSVSVLKNISSAGGFIANSFAPKVDFTVGFEPFGISIADLDADGRPDITAVNNSSGSVSVLRNTTVGGVINSSSFAPRVDFPVLVGAGSAFVADIDGDGKGDIIAANLTNFSILRNTVTTGITASSFSPKVDFSSGYGPVASDVDGDGKVDIVVNASASNRLSIFRNTATAGTISSTSFAAPIDFVGGQGLVAMVDIDGDGKNDIVTTSYSANTLSILRNLIGEPSPPEPTIASVAPAFGAAGTSVTITGTNFDSTPANNIVRINGTAATVTASTATTITATIPTGATTGPVTVQVGCKTGTSGSNFSVTVCFPANGQNADVVLGQTNFTTATSGSGNNKFAGVGSVAVHHASGKIFVADIGNNRILRFSAAQANTIGGVAEAVIGQPDFTTTSAGLSASKLNFPIAITIDQNSGALWVADANNHRILRFDNATTISSGANANGVLGQSDFTTGTAPVVTAAAVGFPWGVALDSNGDLWVGERAWNRVTKFPNAAALPNGSAATVVIGQTNFSSAGIGTSATTLWRPNNVAIDVLGNLWVADELNDRVLKFSNAKNLVTGAAATVVLGQVDFFGNSFATAQNRMYGPIGLHADIFGNIWVGDWANQRVLQFVNAASLVNGANASKVLGAPNFTAIFGGTAQNRTQPVPGLAVDHLGNVYVADDFNRRVLRFNAPSATPIPSVVAVCSGTAATLMATGANPAQEYRWYDVANGGSSLGSSDSFTTPNLTVSSTYYVSLVDAVCNYESGRLPLTVNIISAPIAPATTSAGRCSSGSLALSAAGASPGQYRWYTQATGGTAIAGEVNDTYTTPSLTSTTTYYVSINNGTCESNRTAVTATINPLPADPTTTNASRCDSGSTILMASGGSPGQYRWYTQATGGTPITGEVNDTYTTPSLTSTTTYYVSINTGTCESNRAPVTATVNANPGAPTTTAAARCDPGTVTLTASGASPGEYRWYTQATGGTPITGEVNDTYTTPSLASTTTYFVSIGIGPCESNRVAVTATINPIPSTPTTTGASRCDAGTVALTASGGSAGEYRWYATATGGTPIAGEVNDSFTTPTLTGTTAYYVSINNGACESNRAPVTATINTIPANPTPTGASRCGAGTVTLTAAGAAPGQYRWYTTLTGGLPLSGEVNSTFVTPALPTSTDFYVSINDGFCESGRAAVTASINPVPAAPTTTSPNRCGPGSVSFTAAGGAAGQYRWYSLPTGGTAIPGEVNNTYTVNLTGTTSFYVAILQAGCESNRTTVVGTILSVPAIPTVTSSPPITNNQLELCPSTSATLTAPAGFAAYTWSTGSTGATTTVSQPGSVTLTVRNSDGCTSAPFALTVVSRACAPAIAPPPPQTIPVEGQLNINVTALITSVLPIVPGSLRVTIAPASGARASFSPSGELRIDYSGVLFAGRDVLTIEVCNIAGECAQQQISIEVVGDIIVFNGISPNGDGENEFFYIQYIDVLPAARENEVSIFNRWGDLVWQTRNYDNIGNRFEGKNSSGGELPSGTYYYRIQFASGVSERAGYLSLKR